MTLEDLIAKAKTDLTISRAIWRENNRPGRVVAKAEASNQDVFAPLLQMPHSRITTRVISDTVRNYTPVRPAKGKTTANGSAARALAYLSTVFNWGAARGAYKKQGAGRNPALHLAAQHQSAVYGAQISFERVCGLLRNLVLARYLTALFDQSEFRVFHARIMIQYAREVR